MTSDPSHRYCGRCRFYFPNMNDGSVGTCFLETHSGKIPASRIACSRFEEGGDSVED